MQWRRRTSLPLNREQASRRHEALYERFKADESAQERTGSFRLLNPDDNRERQAVHVHDTTYTPEKLAAASRANYAFRPGLVASASGPMEAPR